MPVEHAESGNLQNLLSQIGAGLEQFLNFDHPDALHPSTNWREVLNTPLPQHGVGIEEVTQDLITQIIPNGSPVPKPGFTSFVTTGSTTASTLASTAASIALGGARQSAFEKIGHDPSADGINKAVSSSNNI